jgi:hypothetical protein
VRNRQVRALKSTPHTHPSYLILDMTEDLPVLQTALSDGGLTRRARRPALSCAECRLPKVKCDRNKPCGAGIRTKSDKCTYRPLRAAFRAIVDPAESLVRVSMSIRRRQTAIHLVLLNPLIYPSNLIACLTAMSLLTSPAHMEQHSSGLIRTGRRWT